MFLYFYIHKFNVKYFVLLISNGAYSNMAHMSFLAPTDEALWSLTGGLGKAKMP
jgi:hypothetical protein